MVSLLRRLKKTKVKDYAYINARVRVMRRSLIPKDDYRKLLNMEFQGIVRYLEETQYKKEIDELTHKYTGIRLMEYALNQNLCRTYNKLVNIASGIPKALIVEYLRRWDVQNIKSIIRGKMFGFSNQEIQESFVGAGELKYEDLVALLSKDSLDEIIKSLNGMPYYGILKEIGTKPLSEIEDDLDKLYYSRLLEIRPESQDIRYLIEFIKMEIDLKNIKTILRLTIEDAPPEEILKSIIPGGYQITEEEARKLAGTRWDELVKSLESYWFWDAIADKITEERSVSRIEVFFDKYWGETVIKKSNYYPLSILPVLSYIILKKAEVDNLRIIARGRLEGIPREILEEQLVIV